MLASLERVSNKTKKWDLENLTTDAGRAESPLHTGSRQNAEKVGRLRFAIKDCSLLRRSEIDSEIARVPWKKIGFVLRN